MYIIYYILVMACMFNSVSHWLINLPLSEGYKYI